MSMDSVNGGSLSSPMESIRLDRQKKTPIRSKCIDPRTMGTIGTIAILRRREPAQPWSGRRRSALRS